MISVEVRSSAEASGSRWLHKARNPTPLVAVMVCEAQQRHPRSGVAIIIRREP